MSLNVLEKPITVCTVVQNCCKSDSPCQWNVPIFRPPGTGNSWTDRHQTWQGPDATWPLWYSCP